MRKGILISFLFAIFTSCYSQEVKWIKPTPARIDNNYPACITSTDAIYQRTNIGSVNKYNSTTDLWAKGLQGISLALNVVSGNDSDHFFAGGQYAGKFYIGKYDSSGNKIWEIKNKTTNHYGVVEHFAKTSKSYYACGRWKYELCFGKDTFFAPFEGAYAILFDENGKVESYFPIGISNNAINLRSVQVDELGNILVMGFFEKGIKYNESEYDSLPATPFTNGAYFLACYGTDGKLKWHKKYWHSIRVTTLFDKFQKLGEDIVITVLNTETNFVRAGQDSFELRKGWSVCQFDSTGQVKNIKSVTADSGKVVNMWYITSDDAKNIYLSCNFVRGFIDSSTSDTLRINGKIRHIRNTKFGWGFVWKLDSNLSEKWLGITNTYLDDILYQNNSIYLSVTKSDTIINLFGKDFTISSVFNLVKISFDHSPLNHPDKDEYPLVYPNPTNSLVHIVFKNNDNDYGIRVFDMQGRLLQQSYHKNPIHIPLELGIYGNGMYFVEMVSGDTRKVVKVVVE